MTEQLFKRRKMNTAKLLDYGFITEENCYKYACTLTGTEMELKVEISAEGTIRTRVIDCESGEEYVLHRVPGAVGCFVEEVRAAYESALADIADKCYDPEVFKSKQAKAVIEYARSTYGDEFEYLWEKFPDNAVVRRKDNRKWYGAILTVSRRKLGFDSDELVEILDLRIRPEDMENTVDHRRYHPGYHMNKKHWYTVCLDESVDTEELCRRLDESYLLAKK